MNSKRTPIKFTFWTLRSFESNDLTHSNWLVRNAEGRTRMAKQWMLWFFGNEMANAARLKIYRPKLIVECYYRTQAVRAFFQFKKQRNSCKKQVQIGRALIWSTFQLKHASRRIPAFLAAELHWTTLDSCWNKWTGNRLEWEREW